MAHEPEHPDPAVLGRFARGEAQGEEVRGVVRHLLRRCTECGTALAQVAPELVLPDPRQCLELSYQDAIHRAAAVARARVGQLNKEHPVSRDFVVTLQSQPRARKLLLLHNSERGRAWGVCEELMAASFEQRHENPARMVELADLAFRVASDLDAERYGATPVIDLQTRAAAELANALRVGEQMEQSLKVMLGALQLLQHGSGDPLLRARVYDLAASVLRHRQRIGLTVALLERAFHIYRRLGEDHLAGRILLKRAITEGHRSEPLACLDLLVQAVELIDPRQDRHLAWLAIHNLLWGLVELGRCEAAAELLAESQSLYDEFSDRLNVLTRLWLEGRIASGLGREHEAEARFFDAIEGFNRVGKHLDAAMVSLDYALLLGRQGRLREVQGVINDILSTFRAMKREREAIAALLVLQDALERQRVPFYLIKKLREYFQRLPYEPGLRFDQVLS